MPWQFKFCWKTQFNIMWVGQALILAMLAMSLPYWPLYIAAMGDYTPQQVRFWSAAIYVAPFITSTFCSPMWGKLGDKYGYKSMVVRASFGIFITQTLILLFESAFLIFLFRLLQGVLAGIIVTTQAWSLAISPETERSIIIGKLQSATAVGSLMGPLLGGIIATSAGYRAIFIASSIISAIIMIAFYLFLQEAPKHSKKEDVLPQKFSHALRSDTKPLIISTLFVILMVELVRQMVIPIFALFAIDQLGASDIMIGILYAAMGLMIFVSAPYWGKYFDKIIKSTHQLRYTLALLLFTAALLQIVHAFATTVLAILIVRLLWGICLGALLPALLRILVDNADNNEHGFFLGLGNSATKLGCLLGIILGALIEANFGYTNSFLFMSLIYFISCVVVLTWVQPVDRIAEITKLE